jgi:hypothetical protein
MLLTVVPVVNVNQFVAFTGSSASRSPWLGFG